MGQERVSMRKIYELLRLVLGEGCKPSRAAVSLNLGETTVRDSIKRAKNAGLTWPLPLDMDDAALEKMLYAGNSGRPPTHFPPPDCNWMYQELKKPHVTKALLWEEYKQNNPNAYQFSQFCKIYRDWRRKLFPTMRQEHKAGDKSFLDFAGPTVPIYCKETGEITLRASIFLAVLGASSYTFAYALASQSIPDWIKANILALEYFGGVTNIQVPDNLKAAIKSAEYYDPDINITYMLFARHYGTVVIPARPRKPKDKAKVEVGVLCIERWIIAALRNEKFYYIEDLNFAIEDLLEKLNNKKMRHLNASRKELHLSIDKPALKPLPSQRFEIAEWKRAKANIDYHVEFEKHYYSVPYQLIGEEVNVRATMNMIEILAKGKIIACHKRSKLVGRYTTLKEHMPKNHQAITDWTPERIRSWAESFGKHVAELVEEIMTKPEHPEQGFRACLGVIRLADKYGRDRLNAACKRSLATKVGTYRSVKEILKLGLDQQPIPESKPHIPLKLTHENIRGGNYYQ